MKKRMSGSLICRHAEPLRSTNSASRCVVGRHPETLRAASSASRCVVGRHPELVSGSRRFENGEIPNQVPNDGIVSVRKHFCAGFTLIELLVVVLIIGILAAIAVPQYQKAVYASRMTEVETVLATVHNARLVHQMATGLPYPESPDELDIGLPADCVPGHLDSTNTFLGWKCKNFDIYMTDWVTLATIHQLKGCNYCHFDKLYPSGDMRCRETREDTLYAQYCKKQGYLLQIQ